MEDILDSKDDENLINLFRLKNRVYNKNLKVIFSYLIRSKI